MKYRHGFVSNSSSSSFIIIGNTELNVPFLDSDELIIPQTFGGETQFGWGPDVIHDVGSRINFSYLQALLLVDDDSYRLNQLDWDNINPLEMLDEVLKEKLKVDSVTVNLSDDYNDPDNSEHVWGYIDHQSSAVSFENIEMFKDKDTLTRFIFSDDSYIELDNDNY